MALIEKFWNIYLGNNVLVTKSLSTFFSLEILLPGELNCSFYVFLQSLIRAIMFYSNLELVFVSGVL